MTAAVRRGLPRTPGGEPWPPPRAGEPASAVARDDAAVAVAEAAPAAVAAAAGEGAASPRVVAAAGTVALRRGLPRMAGGEPWPPAGLAPARIVAPLPPTEAAQPAPEAAAPAASDAAAAPEPRPTPRRMGRAGRLLVGAGALTVLSLVVVLIARWLVGLPAVEGFIEDYPGTYALPEGAPVGIPAWLAWQHFFNVFLIALVLRTGLEVRLRQRPTAFWAPRSDPRARIGLMTWTHQALDVLWVANGAAYIVLLFATGQWMRIVPTSWSVFPNAVSTGLQYASLNWPVEDGWAYYNALQQLTYFVTVFIAAPLAIATGIRMSLAWRGGARWDRIYPKSVARALHFPVMVYFVLFVVGHVALVLATGARRNLNHMYAASDGGGWIGLVIFLVSVVVIAGAVAAMRPLLVAPVARLFGTVSGR
ncbi:cytochrome b/b6 domain-containing protein [Demequina sp. SYSU T00192]|uniref:Cytochrome b/b6 domain-containing protein n=1 Tax=Demequina litoralis TaxID=3051660 RepID=A0ABT8G6A0_9MICO|nr:cytochrome b/b6 domain-containing protein [Demequina sp. SYSU T00192]MDN4474651.1 cytochrome b/b6 domain-containing protein [Demequina sp. SYSU T00192]